MLYKLWLLSACISIVQTDIVQHLLIVFVKRLNCELWLPDNAMSSYCLFLFHIIGLKGQLQSIALL